MSKKFKVVHRITREPIELRKHEFLVLYDSGYPAVVYQEGYDCWLTPVDIKKYEVVFSKSWVQRLWEGL